MTAANHSTYAGAIDASFQATLYLAENFLELANAKDERLVDYYGVEDEEDARTRLSQTLGVLAEHVPLQVQP